MQSVLQAIRGEMAQAVVGLHDLIDELLITLVCRAHSQIEGATGVGKWLAVSSLSKCLDLTARKLRCSPDLCPNDFIDLISIPHDASDSDSRVREIANVVLVDNVALLSPRLHNLVQQAIQEPAVEIHGQQWELPDPFAVFATRYPADEQDDQAFDLHDDRFLFCIRVSSPPYDKEFSIAQAMTEATGASLRPVLSREEFADLRQRVLSTHAPLPVVHYAVRLVRATRVHEGENPDFIYEWVQRGAGPRAVHSLVLAAKARAMLDARQDATPDDLRAVVFPALRHRIQTNRNARSNGITPDRVIQRLLDEIPPRVRGDDVAPRPGESLTFHDWTPM